MFKFLKKKTQKNSESQGDTNLTTSIFKIDGMHCTSCSLNIDGALEDTQGVKNATTSYAKSETKIKYNNSQVNEAELKKIIEKEGYKVV